MARVSTVLCASHSPFLFAEPQEWGPASDVRRANGGLSLATPIDSPAVNAAKHARAMRGYAVLREHLQAARPDVLLIFGDDQFELFTFAGFPALAIYTGESYSGYKVSKSVGLPVGRKREVLPQTPGYWTTVRNHAPFAKALMAELMAAGFDLAMCDSVARTDEGMGHAIMRQLYRLDPEYRIPTVPFLINCYYGPQPTATRCYELGRAVRAAIEHMPLDLSVAVIGSGGLWHMPNFPDSWLDESFDAHILDDLKRGDVRAAAGYFDDYRLPFDLTDPKNVALLSGGTGMVLGVGSGTGETRNWIAAAAVADGRPATVVDYIPVYASPLGAAFAYWESV